MKATLWDSLGVKATVNVYESVEEADGAAGRVGAVLDECNKNLTYRGALAEFREQFVDRIEQATGIARKMKDSGKKRELEAKGADGKPLTEPILVPDETEGKFIERVRAEKGLDEADAWSAFAQPLADQVGVYEDKDGVQTRVSNLTVDIKESERKSVGPKKLPDIYKSAAENIFKNGSQDTWIARLKTENNLTVVMVGDQAKDVQTLGWAIKAREDAKRKAAVQAEYV